MIGFGKQWHQLDHMQTICTSLQTDNHANTSSLNFYTLDALPGSPGQRAVKRVCVCVWMLFLTPNLQYQSTKGSQRHKTANEIMQQIQVKTNWSAIVYYCNDISVNTAHIKVKSSLIIFIHRKNTICLTITSNVDASHFYLLTLTDILFRQEYMTYFE